jgi:hypothetical protein
MDRRRLARGSKKNVDSQACRAYFLRHRDSHASDMTSRSDGGIEGGSSDQAADAASAELAAKRSGTGQRHQFSVACKTAHGWVAPLAHAVR